MSNASDHTELSKRSQPGEDETSASPSSNIHTTSLSSALRTYYNKTNEAEVMTVPSFEQSSAGSSRVLTKISQLALQNTLRGITESESAISDHAHRATVREWAEDASKAPSNSAHMHAVGYLPGGLAHERHKELRERLAVCGTTEEEMRGTDVNSAQYSVQANGRRFFVSRGED
ncbi:hypothetical protein I316_01837 [Kwoniella heveanensis BCC8398]|uniref:Uncharacterized protein n=1 Tax=Kwoniella heveanensis BCC8398 TaxID=1296120 RepID=A0A1B9GZY0_9TREE|nr:hypothetical protein I316_01837 [Kwoniella heveanensis BCC8398]